MGMNKVKLEIEIVTSDKNKIQAETISNYILRAIAGVCGTNRSVEQMKWSKNGYKQAENM